VLGFIGIADPEIIVAEGIKIGPEHREKALEGALRAASMLAAPARLAS
jgi:FMN-dependent NADH-azoreductase